MRRTLLAAACTLTLFGGLAACSRDDNKDVDDVIEAFEKGLGTTLTTEQRSCIDTVVKSYSDKERNEIAKDSKAEKEITQKFVSELGGCVTGAG
jgi:hypothetical protein